jgi:hypothetical protein
VNEQDGGAPVYNPTDTPGYSPFGRPFPGQKAPAPPPKNYSTGPARRGKPSGSPAPAAPPDPWAGVPGAVRDQSNALTDKFLATVGYPKGMDASSIAQKLAKSGVNTTGSPFDAYQWLYDNSGMSIDMKNSNPWSQFGMDKDSYKQTVSKLDSVYASWTGGSLTSLSVADTGYISQGAPLWNAIRGSWTPDQIKNFATFGNAEGTGPMLADAQLTGADPWIGQGQTYTQTLQGFQSFEGQHPTDKATLASWFRFGVSAKTLGNAGEAAGTAGKPLLAGSEVR